MGNRAAIQPTRRGESNGLAFKFTDIHNFLPYLKST